jgi:bifunctional DNA-binding transcriptional regulator/antitoxin component of YhaV-PrlF toxin-antitoxin module
MNTGYLCAHNTFLVGPKGQIVIAKQIRDNLGVKPGWVALQRLVEDRVEIYFLPPEHRQSLLGSLKNHLRTQVGTGVQWESAREAAWTLTSMFKTNKQESES